MPKKSYEETDESDHVEFPEVEEEEDEEDYDSEGEEDDTEGFSMPNFLESLGLPNMGDWGGLLTILILVLIILAVVSQFYDLEEFFTEAGEIKAE